MVTIEIIGIINKGSAHPYPSTDATAIKLRSHRPHRRTVRIHYLDSAGAKLDRAINIENELTVSQSDVVRLRKRQKSKSSSFAEICENAIKHHSQKPGTNDEQRQKYDVEYYDACLRFQLVSPQNRNGMGSVRPEPTATTADIASS